MYIRLNPGGRWLAGGLARFIGLAILAGSILFLLIAGISKVAASWSTGSVSTPTPPPAPTPVQYAQAQNRPQQTKSTTTLTPEGWRFGSLYPLPPVPAVPRQTTAAPAETKKPTPAVAKPAPRVKPAPTRNPPTTPTRTPSPAPAIRTSTIATAAFSTKTVSTNSRPVIVIPRQAVTTPILVPYATPVATSSIYMVLPQRTVVPTYTVAVQPPMFVAAPTIRYVTYVPWPSWYAPSTATRPGIAPKTVPKKPPAVALVSYEKLAAMLLSPQASATSWQLHGIELAPLPKKQAPTTLPAADPDCEFRYER